jgi:hypothetical protein
MKFEHGPEAHRRIDCPSAIDTLGSFDFYTLIASLDSLKRESLRHPVDHIRRIVISSACGRVWRSGQGGSSVELRRQPSVPRACRGTFAWARAARRLPAARGRCAPSTAARARAAVPRSRGRCASEARQAAVASNAASTRRRESTASFYRNAGTYVKAAPASGASRVGAGRRRRRPEIAGL